MPSYMDVHAATTKFPVNSFVFRKQIEKEGLSGDSTPVLGAGGPEFKSRRPDQTFQRLAGISQKPFRTISVSQH
jgi:hypothetical protein